MPTIARFYGITVFMNYNDHLPPHFHARYQDYEITMTIENGLVEGKMPRRALQMIFVWSAKHKDELMDNWIRARSHESLLDIPPFI